MVDSKYLNIGLKNNNCLHGARDALPVAEYLVEVLGPQDVPQRGLGQQPGAGVGVLHVGHTHGGVTHSAGQDKIYFLGKKGKLVCKVEVCNI